MARASKPPAICISGSLSGPCTESDIAVTPLVLGGPPYCYPMDWESRHWETAWQGKKADANRFSNLHHASQRLAVFGWLCLIIPTIPNLSIHYTLFHIRLISGGYPQIHWNPTCSAERLIWQKGIVENLGTLACFLSATRNGTYFYLVKPLAQESHKEAWFLLWVLSNNQRPYASCLPRTGWCFVSAWFLLQWHRSICNLRSTETASVNNSFWWWHHKKPFESITKPASCLGGHLTELSGSDISQCFFHECLEKFNCIQTILTR